LSRAFVKDDSDAPEPRLVRPVSAQPNYVTPRGLAMLREQLQRAESAGDERNAQYLQERIETAIVVEPQRRSGGSVEFGATVSLRDERGSKVRLRIVGEDEADPVHGSVSWESPIAQALVDHRAGERVTVLRPAGAIRYTIETVEYEDAREGL
jgi:transcription elongation factor GreB